MASLNLRLLEIINNKQEIIFTIKKAAFLWHLVYEVVIYV